MQISPVSNTSFNAKIIPTEEWNNYLKYINKYAFKEEGCFDSIKNKSIIERFVNAINNNPSDAEVGLDVFYRKNELFNARGVISSQYGKFTDVEPARSDSGTAPIENIIRRILDPENRAQMCKLFGTKNIAEQSKWWDKYIYPMWYDIKEIFFEQTIYDRTYDGMLNRKFREINPAD